MIEIRRKGKSILAFVLAMIVGISATVSVFPNVVLAHAEDKVNVKLTSATEGATEKIMIKADPALENVEVTAVQLPNGTKVSGNEAEYKATENGNYEFKVFYKEVAVREAEDTAASVMEVEPKIIEGSKVFSYKTKLVATSETVATETAGPKTTALLTAAPETAISESDADDFFIFDPTTQTIVGYSSALSAPKNIVVPSQIAGIDVLHIGEDAFAGRQLKSFVMNDRIQTIGNRAFQNNPEISELVLPTTVTSIGRYAFSNCSGLASMVFPEGVTVLSEGVLSGCIGIRSVTLPANLQEIGPRAFVLNKMSVITIPNTVRSIGEEAFQDTRELTSIVIPEGITTINRHTFYGAWNLHSVTLPNTLETIENLAFSGTLVLKRITLPNALRRIEERAFNNSGLEQVSIPNSVSTIGRDAFQNNAALKTIDISSKPADSITGGPWGSLARVLWSDTVKTEDWLFNKGSGKILKYIGAGTNVIVPHEFNVDGTVYPVTGLTTGVFANSTKIISVDMGGLSITEIPSNTFQNAINLSGIVIPNSVTSIADGAFMTCSSLKDITLPAGLTYLGSDVFRNCRSLTNITIPGGVKRIKGNTFKNSGVATITLKEGLEVIDNDAFTEMKLQKITIPYSVRKISVIAFRNTDNLKVIDVRSKVSGSMPGAPWSSSASILWSDSVVVGDWVVDAKSNHISKYKGTDTNVTIPERLSIDGSDISISSLGTGVFKGNTSIESVVIPNSFRYIPNEAFSGCSNLKSITFPQTLRGIGNSAFRNCAKLTNVVLPNNLDAINTEAFLGCKAITGISLPDTLTRLGTGVFQGTGLVEVVVPESITNVPHSSFQGCLELTKVTLPGKLTNVDNTVFTNTPKLKLVNVLSVRGTTPRGVKSSQPWGASVDVSIRYLGEFISWTHSIENVKGEYARNVTVNASVQKAKIVSIVRNDGTTIPVGKSDWQYTFKVTANGTYTFKAKDSVGDVKVYNIEITDIGKPTLTVSDASITAENAKTITKENLIRLINAKATTIEKGEDFAGGTIAISVEDLAKVRALNAPNESVEIKVIATSTTGLTANKKVSISILGRFPVTFDTKGGNPIPPIQKVTIGEKITEPTEPVKEGHTFAGWYKEESYTTKWDFANDVMPAKDITLYAQWEYANDAIALIEIPRVIDLKRNGSGELVSKGTVKIIKDINQSLKYKSIIVKATPSIRLSNPDVSDYCDVGVWKADGTQYTDGNQPLIYLHPKGDTYPKQEEFTLKAPKTSLEKKGIYKGNMIFQFSWK